MGGLTNIFGGNTGGGEGGGGGNVTGNGLANQVSYWTGANTIAGSNNFKFDGTNVTLAGQLTVGSTTLDTKSQLKIIQAISNATSGVHAFQFTGGAHTAMTNAEIIDGFFDFGRTVQFSGGGADISNQRSIVINAPIYSSVLAQNVHVLSTVYISGAPTTTAPLSITGGGSVGLFIDTYLGTPTSNSATVGSVIGTPGIANGIGDTGAIFGLYASSVGGGNLSLGDQVATTGLLANINVQSNGFTSTGTRTVTTVANHYISGFNNANAGVIIVNNYQLFLDGSGGNASNGIATAFKILGATNNNQQASTEVPDIFWDLNRTVQHATGNITIQRAVRIEPPAYSFVGASTITTAMTAHIAGHPAAGANASFTNSIGFGIGGNRSSATGLSYNLNVTVPGIVDGINNTTTNAAINVSSSLLAGNNTTLGNVNATTTNLASIYLDALPYNTSANTRTVTNAATLMIVGAPSSAGGVTFTNGPYSLWVKAGDARFDGNIIPTGNINTTGSGSLNITQTGSIAIGSGSANAVAALDIVSTTKGFLPSRMTTAQRTAIAAVEGLVIYDTDIHGLFLYTGGGGWVQL